MQPISRESLATNAYRTLGLSGSASQSTIEAAARRMRIWPDPGHIPPTPWDLSVLGPLRRSKSDIEQAVATLYQPLTRLQQRLLWFGTEKPPDTTTGGPTIADRHARVLDSLHSLLASPDITGADNRWQAMLLRLQAECSSLDLLEWQVEVERAGRFEKLATEDEIQQVLNAIPAAFAAGLVPRAIEAFEQHRTEAVKCITAALAAVDAGSEPLGTLCDRLEDDFVNHATEMDRELRDTLRTNRDQPDYYYSTNAQHARFAADYYSRHIAPTLSVLLGPALAGSDRSERVRVRAAQVLVLLALGWEWANLPAEAMRILQQAMGLAVGTVAELEVQQAIDRVTPILAAAPTPLPGHSDTQLQKQPRWGIFRAGRSVEQRLKRLGSALIVLFLIIVMIAVALSDNKPPSRPAPAPTVVKPAPMPSIPDPSSLPDPASPPPINESTGEVNREP